MEEIYQKRALLICPCYKALPKGMQLTCTLTDTMSIKKTLEQKFGFKEEDITVLTEDKATKASILQFFEDFTCEDSTIVLIYYSGHGMFIKESKDEGLLPTVYEWPINTGQGKEVCITGKDLSPFLEKLSLKHVRCTMILDCCHSGQLYRISEFNEADLRPKQVLFEKSPVQEKPKKIARTNSLVDRRGWLPSGKDHFFYFAACSTVQLALEEMYKGGRMTMAVVDVLNKIEKEKKVSYDAFFRLLKREFKRKNWDKHQTPQFEAVNSNTVLFGVEKVQEIEGGIEIVDVPNKDEVVINCGYIQNLRPGRYIVFDPEASKEDVQTGGIKSKLCLGMIDINESLIGPVQSTGAIVSVPHLKDRDLEVGCLAYLESPYTPNINVHVSPTPGSVDETQIQDLVKTLKATMMLNVSMDQSRFSEDPHLITITCEKIKGNKAWVARRGGEVLVPAITINDKNTNKMAENLCRHARYHLALDVATSPKDAEDVLNNVSLKVLKVSNLAYSKRRKDLLIEKGLKEGTEVIEHAEERTIFKGYEPDDNKISPGNMSGDCFLYTVTNENADEEDVIHICVMFYQFDGAITCIYPRKKGKTAELKGGDSFQDLWPVFIPENSLRSMVEPDILKPVPNIGVDTLVLYASNYELDYAALEQSSIETDDGILPRDGGPSTGYNPLSELDEFLKIQQRLIPKSELDKDMKHAIQRIEIPVQK